LPNRQSFQLNNYMNDDEVDEIRKESVNSSSFKTKDDSILFKVKKKVFEIVV
jgi:hypothetical protein